MSVLGKISSITILAISHTTSRGQTRSPHDNFRSFLEKTALTLASGIEGIRGQIQMDCKWEIHVWKKSEGIQVNRAVQWNLCQRWRRWETDFRTFYKKNGTQAQTNTCPKHCHLNLYLSSLHRIASQTLVPCWHYHQRWFIIITISGTRGKRFRVPFPPWQAHHRSHRPRPLHIRPHCKY